MRRSEQRRNAQHVPEESAIPNDDEIEQTVLEIGAGGDVRAESPLRRVREREHHRGRLRRLAVDLDRVFDRLVAKQVAGARPQVRQQPAMVDARGDERRDVRVESDARHIEEQVIAELPRIDDADVRSQRVLDRLRRIERNPQLAREPVAGAARDNAERRRTRRPHRLAARSARATSLIVPSPPHANDEIRARRSSLERQLVRMSGTLGQADLPLRAQPLERARGNIDALGAGAPSLGPGDGIDDDDCARHVPRD